MRCCDLPFMAICNATEAKHAATVERRDGELRFPRAYITSFFLLPHYSTCLPPRSPSLLLLPSPPSLTMMLVHKPHHALALASPASYAHRRHPSAPVVVQPTRTPGLLSLSKPSPPVRPSPSRQIQRQNPRPVAHQKKDPKPSSVVRAQGLTPSAEIAAAKKVSAPAAPATPSPQPRGRTQAKNSAKDKTARYCNSCCHVD